MTDDQFLVLAGLLTEIRDALVPPPEPPSTEPIPCPHPEEHHVSLATLGDPGARYCRLCKTQFQLMTMTPP